jgi:peptidyl-dipeptidase Dcp
MRQLSFGLLDMGWHGQDPSAITDIKAFEQFAATKLYPEVKENVMSTSFSHIFKVDILLDTATSGLKFSMLTLLNSSKKKEFNKEVATKFKDNILLKEEPNIRCLYTNALEGTNRAQRHY